MSNILLQPFQFLLDGIDTLEVSYYLERTGDCTLDFTSLEAQREALRKTKGRPHKVIQLGCEEFLLSNHGTKSGFSFFMQNEFFEIAFGEYVQPNFHVKFSCAALWHEGYQKLHEHFLAWAASIGLKPLKPEGISRVDYAFDYLISQVDFDLDSFVSQAEGDKQFRKNGKVQTFDFGSGDKKLRVYNKSDEIEEQSGKEWFYPLWCGVIDDVWRVEWQVRKEYLQSIGLRTFSDLTERQGDLLRNLATDHTSLRIKAEDSNRSRWPLHPLWLDYLERISEMPAIGVMRDYKREIIIDECLMRCLISMYGYMKRIGAIACLKQKQENIDLNEALSFFRSKLVLLHDSLAWKADVSKRIDEMRFGHE